MLQRGLVEGSERSGGRQKVFRIERLRCFIVFFVDRAGGMAEKPYALCVINIGAAHGQGSSGAQRLQNQPLI